MLVVFCHTLSWVCLITVLFPVTPQILKEFWLAKKYTLPTAICGIVSLLGLFTLQQNNIDVGCVWPCIGLLMVILPIVPMKHIHRNILVEQKNENC